MKKFNFKSFIGGILFCVLIFSIFTVYAKPVTKSLQATFDEIKLKINGKEVTPKDAKGNKVDPFTVDGNTYLPLNSLANAIGYDYKWDATTNTIILDKLRAELSNYTPTKNEGTTLTIAGDEKYKGLPFKATLYYKTTQTVYEGKVGEPCNIKTSSATANYTVLVYVVVQDEKNNTKYELFTTFTPK